MKAYSLDLRQKIIDVYEQEEISQRQLAKRFSDYHSFKESHDLLVRVKITRTNSSPSING